MALDTKQKQGSAMLLTMPFRQWLAEPVVSIGSGEQLSLLKLCSEPLAAAPATIDGAIAIAWMGRAPGAAFAGRKPSITFTGEPL